MVQLLLKGYFGHNNIEDFDMRRQWQERLNQNKLKIDNHRVRLLRQIDENEKPSCGTPDYNDVEIEIKPPKQQKKSLLKPSSQKPKPVPRPSNMRILKQRQLEPVEALNNNRKPIMRMRKSCSTQNFNPIKKEKQTEDDFKKLIVQVNIANPQEKIQQILNHFKGTSVISQITPSTFAISKQDLTIFLKCLLFFHQQHSKKRTSKNHLFVQKNNNILEIQSLFELFQAGIELEHVNMADSFKLEDLNLLQEKSQARAMQLINHKIKQINKTINELKQVEISLTNQILQVSTNEPQISDPKVRDEEEEVYQYSFGVQYKQMEEDLHKYALCLQAQKVMRGVKYDMSPFSQIEESFEMQLVSLTKLVNYNDELTPPMKIDLILNFMKRTMEKLKKWDSQVRDISGFKTTCIMQFIAKMKNWYQQSTFKNEYLVHIKTESQYLRTQIQEHLSTLISRNDKVLIDSKEVIISNLKDLQNLTEQVFRLEDKASCFY